MQSTEQKTPTILLWLEPGAAADGVVAALEEAGLAVIRVGSGEEILARIERADAVVMGWDLPDMSGLECLQRLRILNSLDRAPVILVAGQEHSEQQALSEAIGAGANDCIAQPVQPALLTMRLKTWLRMKELRDAREHFQRIAGHDLRNPLTQILATMDVVTALVPVGAPMTRDAFQLLKAVSDAARRMGRIVDDFLDLHVLQDVSLSLELLPIEMGALLREAVQRHRPRATEKGIAVDVEVGCAGSMLADPNRMEQVIDNLVGNAIKFSPAGSMVSVRCGARGDGWARVQVSDQGPGLSEDDLRRVFERYARLSARPTAGEDSTGLGLSIAHEIVLRHGGKIGVANNEPGPGATFWLEVPTRR